MQKSKSNPEAIPDDSLSIKQAADLLDIRPIQICHWIEEGKLKRYVRERGKTLLVSLGEALRLLEKESPPKPAKKPTAPDECDDTPDDLIRVKEAAKFLDGTHVNTIRRWIHAGTLRAYRLGGYYRVSRADVLALITPHTEPETAPMPPTKKEVAKRKKWVDQRLKELGLT